MTAQGGVFVFATEEPAFAQFGHDLVDEVGEVAGQDGGDDGEAVDARVAVPLLDVVGDRLWCPDHHAVAAEELGEQLPHGVAGFERVAGE